MVFFKNQYLIKRCLNGGNSDYKGGYTNYEYSNPESIMLNVQPSNPKDMDELKQSLNGCEFNRSIVIFSEEKLQVAGQQRLDGDWVIVDGIEYLIVHEKYHKNMMFTISYYRYYAIDRNDSDLIGNDIGGL